ncbi:hypothetical protein GDO78_018033 [Eleutherodactylus coqui]|uniref:Secreted protein n=1 Tax=Eleutherodactylus coqui TaxID=57060 RepID=A0A8J6EJ77_ELECQ|nr:hypothetical protein GDO78_018033 [Eleutherodactylus coqui]
MWHALLLHTCFFFYVRAPSVCHPFFTYAKIFFKKGQTDFPFVLTDKMHKKCSADVRNIRVRCGAVNRFHRLRTHPSKYAENRSRGFQLVRSHERTCQLCKKI